ncbi:MAG: adenylate/guanylate cyclase domain-containing protein [Planctomycetota bacterium]|nr:adenylate/guanylate cyclase domain-containing protein [Planctomycetota bacterium]
MTDSTPTVFCLPDDKHVPVEEGYNLLQALLIAGINVAHACGGSARCSTCRLHILTGAENCEPRTAAEQEMAERLKFDDSIRLACQTRIKGEVAARRLILDMEDEENASQLEEGNMGEAIGREATATVLFADVKSFTSLSDVLPPYDVIHLLNRYFRRAGAAIQRNGGHVDCYIGDGILAVFRWEEHEDATLRAVKAGLDLLEVATGISGYVESWYGRGFEIRVGIHSGPVVAGRLGDATMQRDTIIGDTVNTASRIENACKEAGVPFLISAPCMEMVRDSVEAGRTFALELRGKEGTHDLHEITGLKGDS